MSKYWKKNNAKPEQPGIVQQRPIELNPTINATRPPAAIMAGIGISQFQHQGPLPHSSEIRAYEQIYKGAAKLLFENFDQQSKHRHKMEETALAAEIQQRQWAMMTEATEIRRGQSLAFACVVLFILASVYAFYLRLQWAGSILGICGIGSIVSAFISGRPSRVLNPLVERSSSEAPSDDSVPTLAQD